MYVGLMWSLFLIWHLYLGGISQGLYLEWTPKRHVLRRDWSAHIIIDTILDSTIWHTIWSRSELLHLYFDCTWNNNYCDLQLLAWWDSSWFNPMVKFIYGVGSAPSRARYFRWGFLEGEWLEVGSEKLMRFYAKCSCSKNVYLWCVAWHFRC